MSPISKVSVGWKALEDVLNNFVRAINRRTIDTGFGLVKNESESGIVISLESAKVGQGGSQGPQDDPWRTTPDGETATWHAVSVMDENCNRFSMWVWGGSPK
jgi:hypothetical protein